MKPTNLREQHKLSDRVHAYLRSAILKGELDQGERLVEAEIASQLGVSRSPVREAVIRLQQEGLVEVTGLRVTIREIPAKEIEDLFWIRASLEACAAWLATGRLSPDDLLKMQRLIDLEVAALQTQDFTSVSTLGNEFHEVFISGSGNRKLQEMLTDVKAYIDRFRIVSAASPGRGQEAINDHLAILEAFRSGNPDGAERAVRAHIMSSKETLIGGGGTQNEQGRDSGAVVADSHQQSRHLGPSRSL